MTQLQSPIDLNSAVSQVEGTITLAGLHAPVTIRRDAYGVAHVRAENEPDAWFGQGFAAAQDRLWQMEYDRRRAVGRWSEAAGTSGLAADRLARRLQLEPAARADVAAMSPRTRAMFEAYAAGVNAFLTSGQPLPVEYALTGITPEPWQPWHSVASFKVRHVLMGVWQQKLAQGRLLALIGPEAYARLDSRPPIGSVPILPPGGAIEFLYEQAVEEVAAAAEHLGFLAEVDAGSNSWAVHGSRTTTGMPVICNDSHRALDVPNVYWQVHVACPEFDVVGSTFPGVPAFPHFGHNGRVVWNITHTSADYQDLYVELFDPAEPGRYRTPDGWAGAEHRREAIRVRDAEPEEIEVWRTRHGPVVHGDPRTGAAIALRYTATDRPCRAFEPFRPMLDAATVEELFEAQREWVDPVNNLVAADTWGNIGYLTRGEIPVRSSRAHRQFPVAGWTGEHTWTGAVPFEQLPRAINPPEGFIATANQKVTAHDEPYISHAFAPPSRAERIVELLTPRPRLSPDEVMAMQGDTVSRPARAWAALLARSGPFQGDAERARAMLGGWDGDLLPDSGPALLYAYTRRTIARALFQPVVGEDVWRWLMSGEPPALGRMVGQWLANVIASLDAGSPTAPDGHAWDELLPAALAEAWQSTVAKGGADPAAWRWADHHGTNAKHTLAAAFPELAERLNPPRVFVGGDGDTIQCAGYGWSGRADFDISSLSVYRQCVDLSDISKGSFVVPGGVSGLPGTSHYADQLELWRTHQRIPMQSADQDATHALRLTPAPQPGARTG
jgi:penicillin amidase